MTDSGNNGRRTLLNVLLQPMKIMPVLNKGRVAQTSFPAEKIKEARNNGRERIRQCGLVRLWKNQPKQLLDWIADPARSSVALGLRILLCRWRFSQVSNERRNMRRKFLPTVCTSFLCILCPNRSRIGTRTKTFRGIVLLAKPGNVTLDRVTDPGCSDSVDRSRTDEIAVQQDNLLS